MAVVLVVVVVGVVVAPHVAIDSTHSAVIASNATMVPGQGPASSALVTAARNRVSAFARHPGSTAVATRSAL
jgi:hypothetical protein